MVRQHKAPLTVIFTASSIEHIAVQLSMQNIQEEIHPRGTVYTHGVFVTPGGPWNIVLVEIGSGNAGAAFEVERAIGHFLPNLILFIGIAQGLKDVKPGDVVAATKIYNYEAGRAHTQFEPLPILWSSTYRMEQRARAEARKNSWLQRLATVAGSQDPHVFVAPMVAGEKSSISVDSQLWHTLTVTYSDACAMDTESYGFLQAAHANQQVDALVIRGISGIVGDVVSDVASAQIRAARHASAFAFEILAKLDTYNMDQSSAGTIKNVPVESTQTLPVSNNQAIALYYSYDDADLDLLTMLQKQLTVLRRLGWITMWHKGMTKFGEDAETERRRYLDEAQIILLLVSPSFLSSEQTYAEAVHAMSLSKTKGAIVIPIIGHPTADWQDTEFGKLLALPRSGKALSEFTTAMRDKQLAEVASVIRNVVEGLRTK